MSKERGTTWFSWTLCAMREPNSERSNQMNGNNVVPLVWRGPFTLQDFQAELQGQPEDKAEAARPGVYLHCLQRNAEYYITYVGKADSIAVRQVQHLRMMNHRRSSLINIERFGQTSDIDITYIPDYSNEALFTNDALQSNLQSTKVFFSSVPDDHIIDTELIEGALQIHLWQRMETRKYLLGTKMVSSWRYRGLIQSNLDRLHPSRILGIEPEIVCPMP